MPNILIVDDSPEVRSIVQIFLERDATFTVCGEAGSGLEAIKKAQELKPDLVLLDLRMPGGMNGIETAIVLRSVLPKAQIVLFSAYAPSFGSTTLAPAGVDLVVPKGSLVDMADSLKALTARKAPTN
jgi:DNA-binding NarL/FixJ family response regulator